MLSANDISIKYPLLLAATEICKYVNVHPSRSTCACNLLEITLTSTCKGNLIKFVLEVDKNLIMSATCLLLMYVSVINASLK